MPNSERRRGLDVLRDFSFEELVESHKGAQESYDLTHQTITLMKAAGAKVDGLHRRLNNIARERRCFWLNMKRRNAREKVKQEKKP